MTRGVLLFAVAAIFISRLVGADVPPEPSAFTPGSPAPESPSAYDSSTSVTSEPTQSSASDTPSSVASEPTQSPASPHVPYKPGGLKVIGYWPDWASNDQHTIPYEKLDELVYAFGDTTLDHGLTNFNKDNLVSTIQRGRLNNHTTKFSLSVGGWTGSRYFSSNVATAENRTKFVNTLVSAVDYFQLDGLNMDWEFPGSKDGMSCNMYSKDDTANFLLFLKELRKTLDDRFLPKHQITITAAVGILPFNGPDGNPIKDASEFAKIFNFIYIMGFDLSGNWDTKLGPNSPLYTSPNAEEPFSLDSGVKAWRKAGFKSSQMAAGIPFYGWSASGITTDIGKTGNMYTPFKGLPQAQGDSDDSPSADPCPNAKSLYSGTWTFANLMSQKVLRTPTTANTQNGWVRVWDKSSQSPYLFNKNKGQFITYNDPVAIRLKAKYAKDNKLAGLFAWSLDQDTRSQVMVDAMQSVR